MRTRAIGGGPALLIFFLSLVLLCPPGAPAKPSATPFSIEPGSFTVTPSTLVAGAHPDLTIAFGFGHSEDGRTFNDVKSAVIELPPGLVGAVTDMPVCTNAQLLNDVLQPKCPLDSQLGTVTVDLVFANAQTRFVMPLFNMERNGSGAPVVFGLRGFLLSQLIPMSLRPGDGGLTAEIQNVPLIAEFSRVVMTLWGTPAAASHDHDRGRECLPQSLGEENCSGGDTPATVAMRPLLDNPSRCGAARARIEASSWEEPQSWSKAEAEAGPIVECERIPFDPSFELGLSSGELEAPTGLDLSLRIPQDRGGADPVASSSLASASVALPEGLSIDPAAIRGVCGREEFEAEKASTAPGGGCPPESRLGSAEVETPLLDEAVHGSVFIAKPFDNPLGSQFAVYVVARATASGVLVRLAGRLLPDPRSGQLRISFEGIPQLPLSRLTLRLPEDGDSPLVTPPACGTYTAVAELVPSSDPAGPRQRTDSVEINHGPRGGACSAGLPFHPTLTSSLPKRTGGAFSPLQLHLRREDGELPIERFALKLPPGLVADLAPVARCPDSALAGASGKAGTEELFNPSCPAGSEIGHVSIGMGLGSPLTSVEGSIYLAGAYADGPLSLAIVAAARLGPFDLGTIVVREALQVDPRSGAILIGSPSSDPIPRIWKGIPLHLRDLGLSLDRVRFLRNPTSCRALAIEGTASGAAIGSTGSGESATLSAPFQAAACGSLRFNPRLQLRLLGGVHRNGHPGLRIAIGSGRGEAGLAGATIELPHTELLDPGHVRDICIPQRFREQRCPAGSAFGVAKVFTPFLAEPLSGPIFLRSTKQPLPGLLVALRNRQVSFNLTARLEAAHGGIRISVDDIPDMPISKLVLEMKGGRAGLLVNSVDLCARSQRATVRLTAQNRMRREARPRLFASCRPQ
jgi:hypothetical protein